MREAASLAPHNLRVQEAFHSIQNDDQTPALQKLCSRFVHGDDEEAGREALRYLDRSAAVLPDVAKECMEYVLRAQSSKYAGIRDGILAGLLRESPAAKAALAKRLQEGTEGTGTTVEFERIYNIGDGAANGITAVVLEPSAWSAEASREAVEKDVFQLYLAKLMEVGDDHNGRAMKGISRLLAADAPRLHALMDEDTVDIILSTLDYRNPTDIKSQGTLATAKYLEASESKGQYALTKYVTSKIAQQKNEDLVLAFSAAAAVFPVAPTVASNLFLVEGFVSSLVPMLEKKAKSEKVEHATLEMLSAACIDSACRDAISKHCTVWLQHILETGKGERSGLAAVTLAKLSGPSGQAKETQAGKNMDDLVLRLQKMLVGDSVADKQGSIEGLAYASVQPQVKAQLAKDRPFLESLLKDLRESKEGSSIAFGCLTLINNLTRYPPNITEEQKRVTQLKAYADASKAAAEPDPLDQEAAVTTRCKAVIDAGAVPALVGVGKTLSPASITLLFNILLSLSWPQSHRGIIAQQGGAKVLLNICTRITSNSVESTRARHMAANALARILTSVDPSLVFPASGTPPMTSAIRPIVTLLTDDPSLADDAPRDLLPTFEALMALANLLVQPGNGSAAELIIRLAQPALDDLILHDNLRIRRAATQIMPNLVQNAAGVALFADESDAAARRVHILLALSGSEDLETRKAAGGALAVLTGYEGTVKVILAMECGMELLLAMLEDTDDDVVFRGLHAVYSTAFGPGEKRGANEHAAGAKLVGLDVEEKLKAIIEDSKSEQNSEMAEMVWEALLD